MAPLIRDEFLTQAEELIREINGLEKQLDEVSDPAEKEQIRQNYEAVSQQLQELIDPPSPEEDGEEAEEE